MMKRMVWAGALGMLALCVACSGGGDGSSSGGGASSGGSTSSSSSSGGGGASSSGGGRKALGAGPCEAASECQGNVCVAMIDGNNPPNYCTQECASGSCPSGYRCDSTTFELVGRTFCRFGETPPPGGVEETPSEPPRLPCRNDAECASGEVCGTYGGEKQCTIPCSVETDCDLPPLGGVRFDFMACLADENTAISRTICAPDAACFQNPLACTSF